MFDDDEVEVYGTNPDVYDTDGDGVGDGEEVYLGTNPTIPEGGAEPPPPADGNPGCPAGGCIEVEGPPPAGLLVTCAEAGLTDCFGVCVDVLTDPYHCGGCGGVCGAGQFCSGAACVRSAADGIDLSIDPGYCAAVGLVDCGGVCADLNSHAGHCGTCFNSCPLGGFCQGGACAGLICPAGLTECRVGVCVNVLTDFNHCGHCGRLCSFMQFCGNGTCFYLRDNAGGRPG